MNKAEKIYEKFIETYGIHDREADLYDFIIEEVGVSTVEWGVDHYLNDTAVFKDGSKIVWNDKNEIDVYEIDVYKGFGKDWW